jgi:hypothetical protein
MNDVDDLELELRRLPATAFVAASSRTGTVSVQLKARNGSSATSLRRQAEEVCRSRLDGPFVLDVIGATAPDRVSLLDVAAEPKHGAVSVALGLQTERRTARADGTGPEAAAEATVAALEALLGDEVPIRCEAAAVFEHPLGEGVKILMHAPQLGPRYGVAGGTDPLTAGARATLSALNRYLTDPVLAIS